MLISFSFAPALPFSIPPPFSLTQAATTLAGRRSDNYTRLQQQKRNRRTKGDSKSHHGISSSTVLCFHFSPIWCFRSNHGCLVAQLEGECRRGFKHHHSHNPDARALDGLHMVQHRDVQLHTEIFHPLPPCLHPGSADHHGFVLHPLSFWNLHRHRWDEVHPPRRGQRHQKPHVICSRSLLHPCRNIWIDTNSVVHERDHFKFSGPSSSRKQ